MEITDRVGYDESKLKSVDSIVRDSISAHSAGCLASSRISRALAFWFFDSNSNAFCDAVSASTLQTGIKEQGYDRQIC